MTVAEYLEKLFADSYKREFDQDENVVRSLPFFAASLALVVTLVGYSVQTLLPVSAGGALNKPVPLAILALPLLAVCWSSMSVLFNLFAAVRPRTYVSPPPEAELRNWADQLRNYYVNRGLSPVDIEQAILLDLRTLMIDEYAKSAAAYRKNNKEKMFARSQALSRLVMALVFSFSITIVSVIDKVSRRVMPAVDGESDAKIVSGASGYPPAVSRGAD